MKNTLLILSIVLFAFSCKPNSNSKTSTDNIAIQKIDKTINKIELIDFYGTRRCVTCKAIEANAKYTIDTYFKEEVAAGKVSFRIINVEDENNYDIAERFEATGTALFINVIKDGVERHIDLTEFAFNKGKDQAIFSYQLKNKIDAELKTL